MSQAMEGLLGRKVGMTRIFTEKGEQLPVTVLEVGPCVVVQRKRRETDGYEAVQLGFAARKASRTNRPLTGHFKKAGVAPVRFLREFSVGAAEEVKAGDTITAAIFEGVSHVDVQAVTKGKGFQGVVKRHGFSGGPITHGGHSKRRPGSIGCRTWPARVHKNKRMPGHAGHVQVTQQNLQVVAVRAGENLLLVKGAVPGPVGGVVAIRKALKKAKKTS